MSAPFLVVGHLGQVGRELMLRQAAAAAPLVGIDRETVDIGDASSVDAVVDRIAPALIINAAAYTAVDKAESEPALAYAVNRDGPAHLAAACARRAIPLLHVSTDYVFDGRKSGAYDEDDPPAPLGVYGASKLAGDIAVGRALPQHVLLRTAWVFSAHGTNFVKTILRLAAERPALRVVKDQRGCPTPAAAIADALLVIAARAAQGHGAWGTYNFCGAPATTWHGFAKAIVAAAASRGGKSVPVAPIATADYPTAARRPVNSVLDCRKIERDYGLAPADWRHGLEAAVAELMRHE